MNVPVQTPVSAALVGMHFRPPAKLLLEHLPTGFKLYLQPEPDNAYDSRAIKVLLKHSDFLALPSWEDESSRGDFWSKLSEYGLEFAPGEDFWSMDIEGEWHLGYVKKEFTAEFHPHLLSGLTPVRLSFDFQGKPLVTLSSEEKD